MELIIATILVAGTVLAWLVLPAGAEATTSTSTVPARTTA